MLALKEVTSRKEWERFLTQKGVIPYPFFQSWNFGEVQKSIGYHLLRIGVYDGRKLVGVAQIADVSARRGHYVHIRHGPVLSPFRAIIFTFLVNHVKQIAKNKNASFIRMSPLVRQEVLDVEMLRSMGFRSAPIHAMDSEVSWILDITRSEDALLRDMRKSHRYLIRKGMMNQELRIMKTKNLHDIEKFFPLYFSLSKKKNFVPHKGIREEFEEFGKDDEELLFLADYKGAIISAALIAFVNNMAIYRHSASNDAFKHIPASYLIQWEAIKEAKKRGLRFYNFWGIAPSDSPAHPWRGLTLFKTGFGGTMAEFLHAQDLPLSVLYWKTFVVEHIAKVFKGY